MNSELEREAFAAGMMKAAEMCHARAIELTPESMSEALELGKVEDAIREAIPAESKAALRERDLKIAFLFYCVGLGDDDVPSLSMWNEEAATEILNSILEGKS